MESRDALFAALHDVVLVAPTANEVAAVGGTRITGSCDHTFDTSPGFVAHVASEA